MLTAAGDQDASASALLHTPDGLPRVTVAAGSVLTYCTNYAAVAAHAQAWTDALTVAQRLMLPTTAKLYDLPGGVRAKFTASLSQTVRGNPSWTVTPYGPVVDPGRMASVWSASGSSPSAPWTSARSTPPPPSGRTACPWPPPCSTTCLSSRGRAYRPGVDS